MTVALAPSKLPAKYPTTYRNMLRRAGRLQIAEDELKGLSLPQIKALVKKRYRVLAKHYHPDIVQLNHGKYFREWPEYGLSFRLITKTYQWFQKLDAITEPKKFKLGNNVPDEPLPWYLERKPLTLPFGYQETTEYLAYR